MLPCDYYVGYGLEGRPFPRHEQASRTVIQSPKPLFPKDETKDNKDFSR